MVDLEEEVQRQLPNLHSMLRRTVSRSLAEKIPIEDVVQETYIRAVNALGSFHYQGEASLRGWLMRIAQNYIRSRIRKHSPQLTEIAHSIIESGILTPSEITSRNEQLLRLSAALKKLPDHHQEVLRLRYVEGFTFEEIAQTLGLTSSAVRGLHRNAIQSLKKFFQVSSQLLN